MRDKKQDWLHTAQRLTEISEQDSMLWQSSWLSPSGRQTSWDCSDRTQWPGHTSSTSDQSIDGTWDWDQSQDLLSHTCTVASVWEVKMTQSPDQRWPPHPPRQCPSLLPYHSLPTCQCHQSRRGTGGREWGDQGMWWRWRIKLFVMICFLNKKSQKMVVYLLVTCFCLWFFSFEILDGELLSAEDGRG